MKEKTKKFYQLINKILKAEGKIGKVGKIKIYFTNNQFMRKLNKRFRKIDRATDVLSFEIGDKEDLGEIVISQDWAKAHAARLVIHGVLHLLGYDHKKSKERDLMRKLEEKYLAWA